MKSLFLAPFIFGVLFSSVAKAQIEVEKTQTNTDNQKVNVFTESNAFDDGKKSTEKNLIKLNPLLITFGEVPFYYERQIHPKLSVEIGLGPTIANSITLGITENFDPELFGDNMESKTGFTFKSGLRFYPNGDNDFPEGAYIAPELRYKLYKYGVYTPDANGDLTENLYDLKATYFDFALVGGYQVEFLDYAYADLYLGAGIRKKHIEGVESEYDSNTQQYTNEQKVLNKQVPFITLGLKFGVAF